MSKLEANIPIDPSENTIDSSNTVEKEQDLSEIWSDIYYKYYYTYWYKDNPEDNTTALNIQNPKRLIEYQSEQLTQALETKLDSKEPVVGVDLARILKEVSLVTTITEDYKIEIGTKSHLYDLFLEMSKITNSDLNHLQDLDIDIYDLPHTLERAAKLLPEAKGKTKTHDLRGDLVELSETVRHYLELARFNPDMLKVNKGEENLYNNTYKVYEDEDVPYTKYHIAESESGTPYFKSCGIFIRVEDEEPESAHADFTPFNATSPGEVYSREAIAMAYRGMKNFLHAFDQHQIGTEQLKEIYGYTNPTMAKFVLRFGFRIELDEIDKKDLGIEDNGDNKTLYSREDIKYNNINLDALESISVVGNIEDIRRELERFEEKGSVERIVTGKKNPTSKRDIRYILKKLKKL